jgi:hypothetical protein
MTNTDYDLDTIEHDPYVLISMLTAMQGGAVDDQRRAGAAPDDF